jgi:hypothetical protein
MMSGRIDEKGILILSSNIIWPGRFPRRGAVCAEEDVVVFRSESSAPLREIYLENPFLIGSMDRSTQ